MKRSEMIRMLVDTTIERALQQQDACWLRAILIDGFPGYRGLSDGALARELALRGLLEFDEPDGEIDFDDDPDPEDDDEEEALRFVMLSGMVPSADPAGAR